MDGALFFVVDLLRSVPLPVRVHTVSVRSYHGGTSSTGTVQLLQRMPAGLEGRTVLLIDDILDTGLTLATVQDQLIAACRPATLRTAVLLRKQRPREREPLVDYVGFDIPDEFVVGYGMDYQATTAICPASAYSVRAPFDHLFRPPPPTSHEGPSFVFLSSEGPHRDRGGRSHPH